MKLTEILSEFKIPLTVVSLRAWPNPKKVSQHSGIQSLQIDPDTQKLKVPDRKKAKSFFKPVKGE